MEKVTWFNLPAMVTDLMEKIDALELEKQSLQEDLTVLEGRVDIVETP
jgi:hypothetical protein